MSSPGSVEGSDDKLWDVLSHVFPCVHSQDGSLTNRRLLPLRHQDDANKMLHLFLAMWKWMYPLWRLWGLGITRDDLRRIKWGEGWSLQKLQTSGSVFYIHILTVEIEADYVKDVCACLWHMCTCTCVYVSVGDSEHNVSCVPCQEGTYKNFTGYNSCLPCSRSIRI